MGRSVLRSRANRYVPGMVKRGSTGRTIAVAVVTLGLVAGCSGATEPVATKTPTPSSTPSQSPTPSPTADLATAPERPEVMGTPSAEGAAAAASYFISLHPYIFATGDLAEWDALSEPGCQYCQNVRASVEDQISRDVRGEGSEITVLSAGGTVLAPGDTYAADLEITQAPSFEVTAGGARVPDGDGGRYKLHFALWWRDGWLIRAVDATRV